VAKRDVKRVYYTPGFHSDVVWLEDQRDYAEVLMGATRQYLLGCEADPHCGVFLHELTYLKPYYDENPLQRELIRSLIRAGRVGTGGAHSLPTETLISGEAFVRNIQYGRLYHEEVLGDEPEVLMLWDIFGHCSQLPQIARQCRFRAIIWSKDIRGTRPLFWHQGLDGTKVLTRRVMYGYGRGGREQDLEYLRRCREEVLSLGHEVDLRLDCNDFQPPRGWVIGRGAELAQSRPPVVVSGQAHREYFRELRKAERQKRIFIPTSARDFEWHHQGTGVTHIDLKIANRLCENVLVNAEKFATIASVLGAQYPHIALDKAWRQVMFNQHHDAITGPCCDRSYVDLMAGYREALELGSSALRNSLRYLTRGIKTLGPKRQGTRPLVVFNSNNWERTDVCEVRVDLTDLPGPFRVCDDQGQAVPFEVEGIRRKGGSVASALLRFVATVPSVGYGVYHLVPSEEPLPVVRRRAGRAISNEFFEVEVDADHGGLTRIYDHEAEKEVLRAREGPGNELIALEEDIDDHPEPPWEVMTAEGGERYFSRDYPAKIERLVGPVSERLRVTGPFKDCRRAQQITLYRGVRRIDFVTDLEKYRGKTHLHVVTFPVSVEGGVPVYDDRFGCVVKRRSKGYLDFRTWQWRNYSGCGARRAYQWLDLSSSVRLELGEDSVAFGSTSIVLPKDSRVEKAANVLQEALVRRGVPVTLFYDDCERERRQDLPHQDSTMPLDSPNEDLPWGTSFRVIVDVAETNKYLRELLRQVSKAAVAAWRKRRKEQGWAALFVAEAMPDGFPPLPTLILSAESSAVLANRAGMWAREIRRRARLHLPGDCNASGPQAVEDYGVALLNRGTPLCSVESNGALCMFLMHSVSWGRTKWGPDRLDFHLVAEHKHHRFEYSLYPHTGDWRSAQVPRAAYAYNNPLRVEPVSVHDGRLPGRLAFLQTTGTGILTALKAPGFPLAAQEEPDGRLGEGFIARFYEPTGGPSELRVKFFSGIQQAVRANLLDEDLRAAKLEGGTLTEGLKGFEIESYRVVPRRGSWTGPDQCLGAEQEPGQPVFFKHWRHNMGAAPLGYSPLGISLSGPARTGVAISQGGVTVNRLTVGLSNNLRRRVQGEVELIVPAGWRTVPERIPYQLDAGEGKQYPFVLVFDTDLKRGTVKARVQCGEQTYQDVLEVGEPVQLQWRVARRGRRLVVRVSNPADTAVEAELMAVTSHEAWGPGLVGSGASWRLVPQYQAVRLQARAAGEYRFVLEGPRGADTWVVFKLAYYGRVEYQMTEVG